MDENRCVPRPQPMRCRFSGIGWWPSMELVGQWCRQNYRRSLHGCRRLYCRPADYLRGNWRVQPWLW